MKILCMDKKRTEAERAVDTVDEAVKLIRQKADMILNE